MATYRSIAATETDPQAPITSALMKALDANPTAIAEGAAGAPVNSAAWHPYNMVNVGDGATGVFYDFAVHGAMASATTPTFEDGYDYLIRLIANSGSSTSPLRLNNVAVSGSLDASFVIYGTIEILAPTMTSLPKWGMCHLRSVAGSTGPAGFSAAAATPFYGAFAFNSMTDALSSVSISYSSGNIDAGKIALYRRRNFMFG